MFRFRSRRLLRAIFLLQQTQTNQEKIMASIADLTTAVSGLTTQVTAALGVLTAPTDTTRLSTTDQAALDAAVDTVTQAAANLAAAMAPAAPAEEAPAAPTTVATGPAIDLGSVPFGGGDSAGVSA